MKKHELGVQNECAALLCEGERAAGKRVTVNVNGAEEKISS